MAGGMEVEVGDSLEFVKRDDSEEVWRWQDAALRGLNCYLGHLCNEG